MDSRSREEFCGLCQRCEHRAVFLETGHGPRCECQSASALDSRLLYALRQIDKDPAKAAKLAREALEHHEKHEGDPHSTTYAVCSCYMYAPVKPLVLAANDGDMRPEFGSWMISARMHRVAMGDVELAGVRQQDGVMAYWKPREAEGVKERKSEAAAHPSRRSRAGAPGRPRRTVRADSTAAIGGDVG